jgi:transposase-like protein
VNKIHDYRLMEREYVTSQISLRELCRRHGISAHSVVVDQAKKRKWAEKRETYQRKESDAFIERHSARMADRQAEISDKALDAIDEAITKFRTDMQATEKKRIDGEWVEVPAWYMKPRDMAILLDRLEVLFAKPASITQQGVTAKSELSVDALREFIEATRGRAGPPRTEVSPLPRRRLDD